MKDYELLERQAKLMRMCEGARLDWWRAGIQCKNSFGWIPNYEDQYHPQVEYRFAVAIVEDKAVFLGDELYSENGHKFIVGDDYKMTLKSDWAKCSWNPPKTRTVMIEMPYQSVVNAVEREDVDYSGYFTACRKALEELK